MRWGPTRTSQGFDSLLGIKGQLKDQSVHLGIPLLEKDVYFEVVPYRPNISNHADHFE